MEISRSNENCTLSENFFAEIAVSMFLSTIVENSESSETVIVAGEKMGMLLNSYLFSFETPKI